MLNRIFLIMLLFIGALDAGCSRKPSSTSASAVPNPVQSRSGAIFIKLLPETATSSQDLTAISSHPGVGTWRWEKNDQRLEQTGPTLSRTNFSRGDTIKVTAVSGNSQGSVSITIANSPPEVRSVRFQPEQISRGTDIKAEPKGFDTDGDEISYSFKWMVNGEKVSEESVLKGNLFKKGDSVSVIVTPSDMYGKGADYPTQRITIPKAAPVFVSIPPENFEGDLYVYDAKADDPDGDTVTYSLGSSPEGMKIDSKTGRITWPLAGRAPGSYPVEVVARNSEGIGTFQQYKLTLSR
jgi:hypothetical protein